MQSGKKAILYLSGILPARSETFVYREIFALRSLGLEVLTASVHEPERSLGIAALDRLAESAIRIYSSGPLSLALDACFEMIRHPLRAVATLALACADAVCASDIRGFGRLKVLVQATCALALARRIRTKGVVHIHAHMAHVPTSIAMYAARELGIPFSFTGHANDLFPNRSLLAQKLRRSAFTSCISRWHRDFYRGIYPKDDSDYPIIRCGVDTKSIAVHPAARGPRLEIFAAGRLVAKKGFDILIQAAGIIAERGKVNLSVTIAGAGPEESRLKALIARLPLSARVEMTGELDNASIMERMGKCDIFVLPLRIATGGDRDGIPVVLMESMALGRCAISGDLITIRELIESGQDGFLMPLEDVGALVGLLERLAADASILDGIGARARKKIESEFDLDSNVKALLAAMRGHGLRM